MKKSFRVPWIVAPTFIWFGFVAAISFMEAWLKFQAPGITIPLGLGIGRLVFSALNKVEWVLSLMILIYMVSQSRIFSNKQWALFLVALFILIFQSLHLLPKLDARAQLWIDGLEDTTSSLHWVYIVVEFIKLVALGLFGFSLMMTNPKPKLSANT